jgi:hypothetical protein
MADLSRAEQVTRAGERRRPAAVDQVRVPADVIDVQVGAHDRVDALRGETSGGEVREERPMLVVELGDQRTVLRVPVQVSISRRRVPVATTKQWMLIRYLPWASTKSGPGTPPRQRRPASPRRRSRP